MKIHDFDFSEKFELHFIIFYHKKDGINFWKAFYSPNQGSIWGSDRPRGGVTFSKSDPFSAPKAPKNFENFRKVTHFRRRRRRKISNFFFRKNFSKKIKIFSKNF